MAPTPSPLISFGLLRTVFESEHTQQLFAGTETHDPTLRLVAQSVQFTDDENYITSIVSAALPTNYGGNTLVELPGMIESAIEKGFGSGSDRRAKRASPAEVCLQLLDEADVELFHDEEQVAYAAVAQEGGGRLTYRVDSESFAMWLNGLYYRSTRRALAENSRSQAIGTAQARALFDGPLVNTCLRIGRHAAAVYVDLGDETGQAVEVTAAGWSVVRDSPVRFRRGPYTQPLAEPQAAIPLERLKQLLGLSQDNWLRVLAFILNALRPDGPYMCLLIEAEQGSGKSLLCSIIKRTIDPGIADKLRLPKTVQDLAIHAHYNFVLVYDNASGIKWDLSDALCTLSTGGAFATRKLYTDADLAVLRACRPFIINGIGEFAHRPDLLERAIPLQLPPFEGIRRTEEEIFGQFEELLPGFLGALFDTIACALRRYDEVVTPTTFRMADAVRWLTAAEPACELPDGTFVEMLQAAQSDLMVDRLLNDPLTERIMALIETSPFEGTMGQLHGRLVDFGNLATQRMLPKTPSHLSNQLARLRPSLAKIGISLEIGQRTNRGRPVRIWRDGTADPGLIDGIAAETTKWRPF